MTKFAVALLAGGLAALAAVAQANARVLYPFCYEPGCGDGKAPNGLVLTPGRGPGDLIGTTFWGGNGNGAIFVLRLFKNLPSTRYHHLYNFCSQLNCTDGAHPIGGLIIDTQSAAYGVTLSGGGKGQGEVFKVYRGKHAHFAVLYSFCAQGQSCPDGSSPGSGLAYAGQADGKPYDGKSPLYGTTRSGGSAAQGVAYELQPGPDGWSYQVLYSFCAQANCADGADPSANLVVDSSGNLFGTTTAGGNSSGSGTVFELSSANGSWNETVLYDFCSVALCADGAEPQGGMVFDASGNLEGTAREGGAACTIDPKGCGVVYRLAPSGNGWTQSVVYTFCKPARIKCATGANPQGEPVYVPDSFFGIAQKGGSRRQFKNGAGTLFQLSNSRIQVLLAFCAHARCIGGRTPRDGLVRASAGQIYGAASGGGNHGGGVVYEYGGPAAGQSADASRK